MAPVCGWDVAAIEHFVLEVYMLEAGHMVECKNLKV